MQTTYRDLTCGDARPAHAGRATTLAGWVHRRRDLGQLIFLDLRDRYGITQVVIDAADAPDAHAIASDVRTEFVVQVRGTIEVRREGTENPKLATGAVELRAAEVTILSTAKTPAFPINEPDQEADEAVRLKHRYLDLRRAPLLERMLTRSRLVSEIRRVHEAAGFVDIETPILVKSTPEGARDFIVPSRLQPGSVYALPQSPQQLKQLLMVSGLDRYYQIARCFRDEDGRGDRQPEFTQLDLEMSFVHEEDVMAFVEAMVIEVSRSVTPDRPIQAVPFPRLTYREALDRYGTDKPDLRFGMELHDLDELATGSGFRVFEEAIATGGRVVGMAAPGLAGASRSLIDQLTESAKRAGAKGLATIALESGGGVRSSIAKFLGDDRTEAMAVAAGANPGDLVLIVADRDVLAQEVLGRLRVELGAHLGLADPDVLAFCWIHRFPMYQWDADNGRWDATHNPFSAPIPEHIELLDDDLGRPDEARTGGPRRACAGAAVRPGAQRLGARRRQRAHPPARAARALVLDDGSLHRGHARQVRRAPGCLRVRRPAARRHRPGHRPLGDDRQPPDEHPRGDGLPQDAVGLRPDARGAVAGRASAVGRARAPIRRPGGDLAR